MVLELIREQFGVCLSEVSVGRFLRKLGLSPQKLLRRAYEQDPNLVKARRETDFRKIRALAKRERGLLFFADEASIRSNFHAGNTRAPKGRAPVVAATGQRFDLNLISAISPPGNFGFMTMEKWMNAEKLIVFLERLLHNARHPIFLIVDHRLSHRAKKVLEFIRATKGRLRLFFLPPYSPGLHPDELVWNHSKNHGVGKRVMRIRDQLARTVRGHLRSLQRMPAIVRASFRETHVRNPRRGGRAPAR